MSVRLTGNKNKLVFLLLPFIGMFLAFRTLIVPQEVQTVIPDSITNPEYMTKLVKYQNYYPFIRYERNFIEWTKRSAIDSFFIKLSQTPKRKLKILQIGDSHLQADIPSGYIRGRMQEMFGYGGRGLIFPYKSAGTHAAYDYKTYSFGKWDFTRNTQKDAVYDMGLIGATIHTTDSMAGFRIVTHEGFIHENFTTLKIYCKLDSLSFDIKLRTSSQDMPIHISCHDYTSEKPYILVNLSKPTDTIEIMVNKTEKKQRFFECYGLMVESRNEDGVLYCSTGINGAGYRSILKQRLFEKQLMEFKPDLLILDLGANDFYAGGFNAQEMESNLVKIIDIIQRSSPSTAIIISNSQDIFYRRRRSIPQCKNFMEITRKVAAYRNCGFYNYYDISGGGGSMTKWYKSGLAKPDKVHLTTKGYHVKGELYLNAILNSYVSWLKNRSDSLTALNQQFDTTQLKKFFVEEISFKKENNHTEFVPVYRESDNGNDFIDKNDRVYYTIRSGDNLGSIAERYHVSVKDLQYWNGLSGVKIIAGETLVIYKKSHTAPVNIPESKTETKVIPANKTAVSANNRNSTRKNVYKVVQGDTLWLIARKHNTTVDDLKKLNNLKSDKLNVGQTLIIP